MEIKKRCQWCGEPFIAHKMTTLYCSTSCINKAYKAKKRQNVSEKMEIEQQSQLPIVECIGHKPFLSPKEAACLLGVSIPTIYRYMAQGMFKALRTPAKTIIRWSDLEKWFDNAPAYVKRNNRKHKIDSDTYTMKEICEKYQVTRKVAMRRIEHFDIPKIYEGRNVSFSKNAVDRYFAELIEEFDKEEYYTIQQIMDKFSMSYSAVLSFAMRHKIPRVTRHREVFYSKPHVDSLKGCGETIDPLYYTYKEVMEKYGFSKDQVSYYLHTYNIDRFKRGSFTMINRKDFDKIIKERMNGSVSIAELNSRIEDARELGAE
ncbi:MAG: helix-turn-helix domain-containing protein, partial [Alphaproteobacteria bacterium]|nr:helix-turn-helix domain-containing protein [Alphaproteobacteria bacterium]